MCTIHTTVRPDNLSKPLVGDKSQLYVHRSCLMGGRMQSPFPLQGSGHKYQRVSSLSKQSYLWWSAGSRMMEVEFHPCLICGSSSTWKKKKKSSCDLNWTGMCCEERSKTESGIGSTVDDWSGNDGDRVNTIRTLNNIIPLGVACMRVTP